MPNSETNPKTLFFQRFFELWRTGRGRGDLVERRKGREAETDWNELEFQDAVKKAGGTVSDDTIRNWLAGGTLPQRAKKDAMLRVFFQMPAQRPSDKTDRDAFDVLWATADTARQRRSRKPPRTSRPNFREDWRLNAGHEFTGLVKFRTSQPVPKDHRPNHYDVPAELVFGKSEPLNDDDVIVELSLGAAYLEIPATSYQPTRDCTIGDAERPNRNFQPTAGGQKIVGPAPAGYLDGNVLGADEYITTVEPAQHRGGPLTIRITAPPTDIRAAGKRIENGKQVVTSRENNQVVKLLLQHHLRVDDVTGRVILAERQLIRKRGR